jgi:hypothetical protein
VIIRASPVRGIKHSECPPDIRCAMLRRAFSARRATAILVASVVASAGMGTAVGAGDSTRPSVSPPCALYAVTLVTETLVHQFNSPNLTMNAKKWPRLMAEARTARAVFVNHPRLRPVLPHYDALVNSLGKVGKLLIAGRRAAAYRELKRAVPDLKAVVAAAKRVKLACKSGGVTLHFG